MRIVRPWIAGCLALATMACGNETPSSEPGMAFSEDRYEVSSLVAHLAEDDPQVALFGVSGVVEVAGSFVVSDTRNKRLVRLSDGLDFLEEIGGEGDGPGEYQMPTALASDGDHIAALDEGVDRVSMLTHEGSFLERMQIGGPTNDVDLHPSLGALVVTKQFPGFYLARVGPDEIEAFGEIPQSLLTEHRVNSILPTDRVAVTPDGAVHVLDEPGVAIVSYSPTGDLLDIRLFPASFRAAQLAGRQEAMESFGPGLLSVSLIGDLVAMPDGRLLVLSSDDTMLGMVLDLETNEATRVMKPTDPELDWVLGGSAALFDGRRLLLTHLTWVAVFETRLVEASPE